MTDNKAPTLTLEGAQIIFRNFAGKKGPYNETGRRSFGVILEPDVASTMAADGWNVKTLKPQEGEEVGPPWVDVTVGYENYPPRIVMITDDRRTNVDENMVDTLDYADIANVDLVIRGYNWEVNGKGGIKAYLKTAYFIIDEDELERKYAIPSND